MTITSDAATIAGSLAAFRALPEWLAAGKDAEKVGASLTSRVPEFRDGRLRLLACRCDRLRAKGAQGGEWLARYVLTVMGPESEPAEVVLVGNLWPPGTTPAEPPCEPVGAAFGESGWRCSLPEPRLDLRVQPSDEALPALPRLVDAPAVARLVEPILREGGYRDATIRSCNPVVARYKPGSRCTVVVTLDCTAPPHGPVPPDRVVLKTYHGDKGATAWAAMNALWRRRFSWRDSVRMAEPLGYLADERILVQGPVPGERTLKDLAWLAIAEGSPELLDLLRIELVATARALAAVHGSGTSYGRTATLEEELDEVHENLDRLARSMPWLAPAALPLLSRLAELAGSTVPDPVVPSHQTFRPAQVLLGEGGVGFIDFDGAGMAEPALDVSRFRGALRGIVTAASRLHEPERSVERADARLSLADDLCEAFLSAYQEHATVSRDRVLLWETCDLLTVLLSAWAKARSDRVGDRLAQLEHQILTGGLLDGGSAPEPTGGAPHAL